MRKKLLRPEKIIVYLVFFAFCLMTVLSCRLYNLKKDLNPKDKEFLSKVSYIISKEDKDRMRDEMFPLYFFWIRSLTSFLAITMVQIVIAILRYYKK